MVKSLCGKLYLFAPRGHRREKRSELFLHPEPILGIDFRYYNTRWCATFQDKFLADLTQSKDDEYYNILLFEDGQLVKKLCLQRPS